MSNPFDAPTASAPPPAAGSFDVMKALSDGWAAVAANPIVLIGASVIFVILTNLSVLLCVVPVMLVGPLLFWGGFRLALDALDDRAELETLFSGFQKIGDVLLPILGLSVLMVVASLPGFSLSLFAMFAGAIPDVPAALPFVLHIVGCLMSLGWLLLVLCRFLPAPVLLVDRGMGPLEAMGESWALTGNAWGGSIVMSIAQIVLGLIGVAACCVGVFVAAPLTTVAIASMTRQLLGER